MLKPSEALNSMCHTSERTWDGTIYTISDQRFPEYNGKKILVYIQHGKNKTKWIEDQNGNR